MPTKEFKIICEKHCISHFFNGCRFPSPSATYCPIRAVRAMAPSYPTNLTSHCSPTATLAIIFRVSSLCLYHSTAILHWHCIHEAPLEWNTALPSASEKSSPDFKNKLQLYHFREKSFVGSKPVLKHFLWTPTTFSVWHVTTQPLIKGSWQGPLCCKRKHSCPFK